MKHREKVDALLALERAKVRVEIVSATEGATRNALWLVAQDIESVREQLYREVRDAKVKR